MSDEMLALGRAALAMGIDSQRVGRSFVVFALVVTGSGESSETALRWYVETSDERAAQRARHETATSGCQRYAIAVLEEIRDRKGDRRLAVVVEVGSEANEQALRMAQPFEPFTGPSAPLAVLGSPMMLGDTVNVLRGSSIDPGKPPAFVVVCPKCARHNRVSFARVRERLPNCGSCKTALASSG